MKIQKSSFVIAVAVVIVAGLFVWMPWKSALQIKQDQVRTPNDQLAESDTEKRHSSNQSKDEEDRNYIGKGKPFPYNNGK